MQTKTLACILTAGLILLPMHADAAEKADIHTVITAEERHAESDAPTTEKTAPQTDAEGASTEQSAAPDEDSALAEEMGELGGEKEPPETARAKEDAAKDAKESAQDAATESTDAQDAPAETDAAQPPDAQDVSAADDTNTDVRHYVAARPDTSTPETTVPADGLGAADENELYGEETAIDPIALAGGDWVFVEGDERRGWFVDRSKMRRNADGSLSYWQLILYNEFGRAQFARAMEDDDYKELRYTLQRRVLDLRKNTVRTYEIIAIGADEHVLADSTRDGAPAAIRPDTMAEKERDTVKKLARGLKSKR